MYMGILVSSKGFNFFYPKNNNFFIEKSHKKLLICKKKTVPKNKTFKK